MASSEDVIEILAMLGAAYPRFSPTKETVQVYTQLLADLPADYLRAAAMQCATSGDFFPSVHELRRAASDLQRGVLKVPEVYEAWEEVIQRAHETMTYFGHNEDGEWVEKNEEYQWSHPVVKRVAESLGWPRFFPGENLSTDRAHFFKMYEAAMRKFTDENLMLPEVRQFIESRHELELGAGDA
jgi:hypothetical protein